MACLFGHKWNGCKCDKCGKQRDESHKWNGCKCSICGKIDMTRHKFIFKQEEQNILCEVCGYRSLSFEVFVSALGSALFPYQTSSNEIYDSTQTVILEQLNDKDKKLLEQLISRNYEHYYNFNRSNKQIDYGREAITPHLDTYNMYFQGGKRAIPKQHFVRVLYVMATLCNDVFLNNNYQDDLDKTRIDTENYSTADIASLLCKMVQSGAKYGVFGSDANLPMRM